MENSLRLAEHALFAGRLDEARIRFSRVIAKQPRNANAKLGLAEVFLASGDASKAAAVFRDLANVGHSRPLALEGEGVALVLLNDLEGAERKFKASIALRPTLWRAWNGLGYIYDRQRRFANAEQCYAKALALTDRAAVVHNNLGYSYLIQKRFREAEQHFMKALEADASLSVARGNLRLALAWQGRYVDAMAGVPRRDRARAFNNMGFIAMLKGDHGRAKAYFTRAMLVSASYYVIASRNMETLRGLEAGEKSPSIQRAGIGDGQ